MVFPGTEQLLKRAVGVNQIKFRVDDGDSQGYGVKQLFVNPFFMIGGEGGLRQFFAVLFGCSCLSLAYDFYMPDQVRHDQRTLDSQAVKI